MSLDKKDVALLIMGPTTTGKTKVARAYAIKHSGEIINGDKFYLYKDFTYSTGASDNFRGTKSQHHLYQILDPQDPILSTEEYISFALYAVDEILERGNLPIAEGCSYKFMSALQEKLKSPSSKMTPVAVGLRWSEGYDLEGAIRKRWKDVFPFVIKETEAAIRRGLEDSYVMKKGIILIPTAKYLKGELSKEELTEEIVKNVLEHAHRGLKKFSKIEDINWIEYNPNDLGQNVSEIEEILSREGHART
ncbi:MAG: isopentenyl transferase family protein [Candidatus Nanoarchaeia archaeon]|nr:isopentenyl transferase family protein [Candidatus Nanoarchaeia archaeon]